MIAVVVQLLNAVPKYHMLGQPMALNEPRLYILNDCTINASTVLDALPSFVRSMIFPDTHSTLRAVYTSSIISTTVF